MKNILFLTTLLAVALATGCKKPADKPAVQSTGSPALPGDHAQTAINDAAGQMPDYTFAQKAEFTAMMQTHLADLNRSMDEFAAIMARSSDAIKDEAGPRLATLRLQAKQLEKQLGTVTSATSSTWNVIKTDSEKAYSALKDGVTQSREWISTKITP
jgi:hypothetical protein